MGPRKILVKIYGWFFLALGVGVGIYLLALGLSSAVLAAPLATPRPNESAPASPSPEALTPWTLLKQKLYPNYKVEIYQRMTIGKFPRVDSMKARIIPQGGGSVIEYKGTWLNPDPRTFVMGWRGGPLDLDGDGLEELVLQNYSAGVHCCYNYVIYSLAKPLKKLANLPMKDCGSQIRLEDLDGDKKPEIISCNADFTYLGKLPFSDSPFPPAVYALRDGIYRRADKEFKQVFQNDIQTQRADLAKAYSPTDVLQIVTDYFLMGDEIQGWKEFDSLYQGDDKEAMRTQLLKRLGKPVPPETQVTETKPSAMAPMAPALATPQPLNKLP